ncbi:MAG: hypothetical protein AAGF12_05545 [Myxococcota bacterium]
MRKAKAPKDAELVRPVTFVCDGATTGLLTELVEDQDEWGLRLEGRWGPGSESTVPSPGPHLISAKGVQGSKAAVKLAAERQPQAFAADKLDDKALAALGKQPKLRALRVWYTKITDDGLATIASFKGLTQLNAGNNAGVTAEGLVQLSKLSKLTHLNIEATALDDRGLKAIAKLKKLRHLEIAATKVTDEGVEALFDHPALEHVSVFSTKASKKCIKRLESCLKTPAKR